jgi:hypothetical protein
MIENRMTELVPHLVERLVTNLPGHFSPQQAAEWSGRYIDFFLFFPPEVAKEKLYGFVDGSDELWKFAVDAICQCELLDVAIVLRCLRGTDDRARQRILDVVGADLPTYSAVDVPALEELEREIRSRFPRLASYTAKGLFGGKEVWRCPNGHEITVGAERCGACGVDRFGFKPGTLTPMKAAAIVSGKIAALKSGLNNHIAQTR